MKRLDLTHLGGFPLTQDMLDWLQNGYMEALKGLARIAGPGPTIISGMEEAGGVVSDGWLFFNNELVPFLMGNVSTNIVVFDISDSVIYDSGSEFFSKINKVASFGSGPVQFPYSSLKRFDVRLGERARTGWVAVEDSANVKVFYMFNRMTGVVTVRGSVRHSTSLGGGLPMLLVRATLPAGVRPGEDVYFRTNVNTHLSERFSADGGLYTGDVGRVSVDGSVAVSTRALASGSPDFFHEFYLMYNI